jgi:hypothetical protein
VDQGAHAATTAPRSMSRLRIRHSCSPEPGNVQPGGRHSVRTTMSCRSTSRCSSRARGVDEWGLVERRSRRSTSPFGSITRKSCRVMELTTEHRAVLSLVARARRRRSSTRPGWWN